jgi:3'-5' exoribonuclease
MLHYLDDLDSKMESMRAHFEREVGSESDWTGYNPSLGRPLLNSRRVMQRIMGTSAEAVQTTPPEPDQKQAEADNKEAVAAAAAASSPDGTRQ